MSDSRPDETVLPLVEETATIETRQEETGRVRIRLVPEEQAGVVEDELTATSAEIERVSIGMFVDEAPRPRWDGDVFVMPVVEEVLVTEKKLRLVEEVRIRSQTTTRHVTEPVTLRRMQAFVEHLGPEEGRPHKPSKVKPESQS